MSQYKRQMQLRESTYTLCGCAAAMKRLGPANRNGSDASSNMRKGSLAPPIIPDEKHAQSTGVHPMGFPWEWE